MVTDVVTPRTNKGPLLAVLRRILGRVFIHYSVFVIILSVVASSRYQKLVQCLTKYPTHFPVPTPPSASLA